MLIPIYAALLAALFVYLSIRVIRVRRRVQVAIGAGGQAELERAMRVHANFAEYVPIALIMVFFTESLYGSGWWIHALGAALLIGRVLHAWGVSQGRENFRFRVTGMSLTFTVILASATANLLHYVL